MSKKDINLVKSAIRKISRHRKEYNEVRKRCKVREVVGKIKTGKNKGKDKLRIVGERCEHCGTVVEKVQVDHVVEIGKLKFMNDGTPNWSEWIPRVLCALGNLQGLCEKCHKLKTESYNAKKVEWQFYL